MFRAPNLLTVPGDPIAGFLLAQAALAQPAGLSVGKPGVRMALAAAVSVLIYAAGLLWNDWFDRPEDIRERPDRPLPSGRVRPAHVALVANTLVAAAVATAAVAGRPTLWVTVALGMLVLAYNMVLKRSALLGPLAMGACRGLSVLVGAAAFGVAGLTCPLVIAAGGGITLYVAAVTWLARGETRQRPVTAQRIAIAAAFAAWVGAVGVALLTTDAACIQGDRWKTMALVAAVMGLWLAWRLARLGHRPEPRRVQKAIGGFISMIILVQAALVLVAGRPGHTIAFALMACFALNQILGRVFYAS